MADSKLCGLKALIQSAGLAGKGVDSTAIGFRLAPVLNAAGRMGHARLAVELLTSTSEMRAMQIAEYLKDQNTQRQQCERKMLKQACEIVVERGLNHPDRRSIVLAAPGWHTGVLGIVASRLVDRFYRPAIMINASPNESGLGPGLGPVDSGIQYARRDRGVRVASDELRGPQDGGGPDDAAGEDRGVRGGLRDLRRRPSPEEDVVAKMHIDALVPLRQFTRDVVHQLDLLGPFGEGNPKPVFATKGVRLAAAPRRCGSTNEHLQFVITDNSGDHPLRGLPHGRPREEADRQRVLQYRL